MIKINDIYDEYENYKNILSNSNNGEINFQKQMEIIK